MSHNGFKLFLIGLVLFAAGAAGAEPDYPAWTVELESGAVWQGLNKVQVPNDDTGTRFSLVDVVGNGPWPTQRATLVWRWSDRHAARVLYAPLSIIETGELAGPVAFAGGNFAVGAVEAEYRFDSYRATYRYLLDPDGRWQWWLGFTAKIRDAEIALTQGGATARKTDLGFVPLLHLSGQGDLGSGWRLQIELDALAGGPGRAEDLSLKLGRDLGRRLHLAAGYRMIEGGADVDSVYAFAWLHYAVVSLSLGF